MIDIAKEKMMSLTDAAKTLPRRPSGKAPHVATLYRWAQRGLNGVRLETVQVGGTRCTSQEAMARFFEDLENHNNPDTARPRASRSQQVEKAAQLAKKMIG